VKWSTAATQLGALAEQCERFASPRSALIPLRVTQLWAVGDVLGRPRDLDRVTVAFGVDVPPELVPWWCRPEGARWWADMTRLSKNPVRAWWRSTQVPIWNHRIIGPVLIWDDSAGAHAEALTAIRDGRGAAAGLEEPSQEEYVARMSAEQQISLIELQRRTHEYETDRTARLGVRADALFAAAQGYLDVLAAQTEPAAAGGS
jgi:hypothetical protein